MNELPLINRMVSNVLWNHNCFSFKIEILKDNPNPDELKKNIVYVVVGGDRTKWAYLRCPCGCNDIIMLSLDRKLNPSWSVKQDKFGRASIFPSINKLAGCRSHFWIKKGKLKWVLFF